MWVRRPPDVGTRRRLLAILRLMGGYSVVEAATLLEAARSPVYRWADRYRDGGLCALVGHRRGRRQRTVSAELI